MRPIIIYQLLWVCENYCGSLQSLCVLIELILITFLLRQSGVQLENYIGSVYILCERDPASLLPYSHY